MKNPGYIKINRAMFQRPEWTEERFSKSQAWIDLLGLAAYKDTYVYIRSIKIDIPRGSLATSMRTLAKRWKWDIGTVCRYIQRLESDTQIHTLKNAITTLISITNYDKYQSDTYTEPNNDTHADAYTIKEINKINIYSTHNNACVCAWDEFHLDDIWLEQVQRCVYQRCNNLMLDKEQIEQYLEAFKTTQIAGNVEFYEKDARSHFINWLLIEINKQKQNGSNTTSGYISRDEQRKKEQEQRLNGYADVIKAMQNGDYEVQDPTSIDY